MFGLQYLGTVSIKLDVLSTFINGFIAPWYSLFGSLKQLISKMFNFFITSKHDFISKQNNSNQRRINVFLFLKLRSVYHYDSMQYGHQNSTRP